MGVVAEPHVGKHSARREYAEGDALEGWMGYGPLAAAGETCTVSSLDLGIGPGGAYPYRVVASDHSGGEKGSSGPRFWEKASEAVSSQIFCTVTEILHDLRGVD
jgi:hypothetical protein